MRSELRRCHYNATENRKVDAATAKALRLPTGEALTHACAGLHSPVVMHK